MSESERETEARAEAREKLREQQHEREREQAELQQAYRSEQGQSPRVIEELLSNDELVRGTEDDLQEATKAKLRSVLSRDVVLANLSDGQEHDIWYKLQVLQVKVERMHPPEEGIGGAARAYYMDDESEALDALSQRERVIIDDLITALQARLTRGRGGFERKQQNTSIAQSETNRQQSDDSGGRIGGLFS